MDWQQGLSQLISFVSLLLVLWTDQAVSHG